MQTPTIKPLTDFPDYQAATDRRNQLCQRLVALDAAVTGTSHELASVSSSTREGRARALAEGRPLTDVDAAGLDERLAQLRRERSDVHRAVELVDRQMADLAGAHSAEVAASLLPTHRLIVQRLAKALVEMCQTQAEEVAVRAAMQEAGYSGCSLRPMLAIRGAGDLTEYDSNACVFLRECVEYGYLPVSSKLIEGVNAIGGGEDFLPVQVARRAKEEAARQADKADRQKRLAARTPGEIALATYGVESWVRTKK